nr:MAG TPA: hypothetical protein [Caudoviricetes sp.]
MDILFNSPSRRHAGGGHSFYGIIKLHTHRQ